MQRRESTLLNAKYDKIEWRPSAVHIQIKIYSTERNVFKQRMYQSKERWILKVKYYILEKWAEYFGDLFDNVKLELRWIQPYT